MLLDLLVTVESYLNGGDLDNVEVWDSQTIGINDQLRDELHTVDHTPMIAPHMSDKRSIQDRVIPCRLAN